jgi:hypothetical protein
MEDGMDNQGVKSKAKQSEAKQSKARQGKGLVCSFYLVDAAQQKLGATGDC